MQVRAHRRSKRGGGGVCGDAGGACRGNRVYEERFGYIFIVCATGRSAGEMLGLLRARLGNEPGKEILIAMGEQEKITKLRLEKLLS